MYMGLEPSPTNWIFLNSKKFQAKKGNLSSSLSYSSLTVKTKAMESLAWIQIVYILQLQEKIALSISGWVNTNQTKELYQILAQIDDHHLITPK